MKLHHSFTALALAGLGFMASVTTPTLSWAQSDGEDAPDGPWISSVVWQSESELLGTRSQGLLFRPADVVRASSADPQDLTAIGHCDTSLWSVCALDDGRVVASDYRGGVWLFAAAAVPNAAEKADKQQAAVDEAKTENADSAEDASEKEDDEKADGKEADNEEADSEEANNEEADSEEADSEEADNEDADNQAADGAQAASAEAPSGQAASAEAASAVALSGQAESPAGKPFELDARWIRALKKTPQAGQLLAGTEDGKLLLLSVDEAKEIRRVDAHAAAIFDIAFSAAGDKVATAAGDGSIKIFNWPQLEPLASMTVDKDTAIWSLLFVNDDKQIVSGGSNNAIQLWDVASAQSIVTIAVAGNWVTSLAALPESHLVVAGCMDGKLVVVDWQTMHAVHSQAGPGSAIWSVALAPHGQQLAVATRKHGLAVVDTQPWLAAGQAAAEALEAVRPPAPPKR